MDNTQKRKTNQKYDLEIHIDIFILNDKKFM